MNVAFFIDGPAQGEVRNGPAGEGVRVTTKLGVYAYRWTGRAFVERGSGTSITVRDYALQT